MPKIVSEKDIIWEDSQTKEVFEHFNAANISLALTGTDLTWIQVNKPEILDYVLVKGIQKMTNSAYHNGAYHNDKIDFQIHKVQNSKKRVKSLTKI